LRTLGVTAAWVVHGTGGLDEVSPSGPTSVAQLAHGEVTTFEVSPTDFGLSSVPVEALGGGDAQENAAIIRRVLSGEQGPARAAVVLNAAAALCVTGVATTPKAAADRAAQAIDRGAARSTLERWAQLSRES
jgi:anthranilate phosphoribosyltransferase